jgi:hypothetical protein
MIFFAYYPPLPLWNPPKYRRATTWHSTGHAPLQRGLKGIFVYLDFLSISTHRVGELNHLIMKTAFVACSKLFRKPFKRYPV